MNLPKKKSLHDMMDSEAVKEWNLLKKDKLDSEGMQQLADYWKVTIRLRALRVRMYTNDAREMEKEAFKFLSGDERASDL